MALVKTAGDVRAIAGAMERAAVERYTVLSDSMRRLGHDEIADVFQSLTEGKRNHAENVDCLMAGFTSRMSASGCSLPLLAVTKPSHCEG